MFRTAPQGDERTFAVDAGDALLPAGSGLKHGTRHDRADERDSSHLLRPIPVVPPHTSPCPWPPRPPSPPRDALNALRHSSPRAREHGRR